MRTTKLMASMLLVAAIAIGGIGCTKKNDSSAKTDQLPGKTLRLYLKDNIKSGDPAGAYDVVSLEPLPQVYEALYQYHYYSNPRRVVPQLAEGMPVYSADQKTATIKLKKGVMFQNDPCFEGGKGRELKAKDFLFAWKRHTVTDVRSEGFWIFDGKVVGINDFKEKYKDLKSTDAKALDDLMAAEVEGMKALDDYTIQLKFTKPYPQLLNVLVMLFSSPVAIEAIKKYGPEFVNHPVGTGPYKVVSWEPQNKVVLTRNESFHGETFPADIAPEFGDAKAYAGKALPFVDNIVFRVIREDQPRWLEAMDGNLDQIEIPKDNTDAAVDSQNRRLPSAEMKNKGLSISIEDGVSYWYMFINMDDKFLGEHKEVRQAISMAMDRKAWMKLYRDDRGVIATEINPVGVADRCGKTAIKYDYNPEKAKQLLAKAGFPEGKGIPEFTFDLRGTNTAYRQIGEWAVKSLGNIGIKAKLIPNTFPAFLDKRQKKNLQIAYGGWVMDYPDAENNMALLYGPFGVPGVNETSFNNKEFNDLYAKMSIMTSSPERRKIICQMDDIVQEESPLILGFYESEYRLISKRLKNYHTAEIVQNKYKYVDLVESPAQH